VDSSQCTKIYIQERLYDYTLDRSGNSIRGSKVSSPKELRTSFGSGSNTKQRPENDCRYSMCYHALCRDANSILV